MKTTPLVYLVAALPCVLLAGCGHNDSGSLAAYAEAAKQEVVQVPVTQVVARDFEETVTGTGSLRASRKSRIQPKVPGQIVWMDHEIGESVRQGEPLVRLRTLDYEQEVANAEAALELARAQLLDLEAWRRPEAVAALEAAVQQAEASLKQAERDYQRKRELLQSGSISPSDYDRSEESYRQSQAALKAARAQLQEATSGPTASQLSVTRAQVRLRESQLRIASQRLEDCTLVAPYDAVVTRKLSEVGEQVTDMPPSDIMEVSDLSTLHAYFLISEFLAPYLQVGTPGRVEVVSTGTVVDATVVAVNRAAEETVRAFGIKAEVPNAGQNLKAGLFVRGTISLSEEKEVPSVPMKALRYLNSEGKVDSLDAHTRALVFVIGEDDTVEYRTVELGLQDREDYMQVVSGLRIGERIVADASLPLQDGQKVQPVNGDSLPEAKPTRMTQKGGD